MKVFTERFSKGMDIVEKILMFLIGVFMVVMVAVIFYQVILRYTFAASNIWSEELARYLMCYVVLLGAAVATRKYSHLQVDFAINLLPPRAKCIAVAICTLAGMIFLGYFIYYGIMLCISTSNSISPGIRVPMSYVYACLPVGGALMILSSIEVILKELVKFTELSKNSTGGGKKA